MAPKTMPRVIINPDAVRGECVCADLIFINGQTAYNMTAGRNHAENDIFFRTGMIRIQPVMKNFANIKLLCGIAALLNRNNRSGKKVFLQTSEDEPFQSILCQQTNCCFCHHPATRIPRLSIAHLPSPFSHRLSPIAHLPSPFSLLPFSLLPSPIAHRLSPILPFTRSPNASQSSLPSPCESGSWFSGSSDSKS